MRHRPSATCVEGAKAVGAVEGTRDALTFGTPCWQPLFEGFYSRGPIERDEDCLT